MTADFTPGAGELPPRPPQPAPGGPDGRHDPPVAGLNRVAVHEAAHATGAVWLLGSVRVVSLRKGREYNGVTLLDDRSVDSREVREQEIVVTLLGDIAVMDSGLLEGGWQEDTEDQAAAIRAVASLDRLASLDRIALLDAEAAEPDLDLVDERCAWRMAWPLNEDALAIEAHLTYLRIVADGFVRRHRNAIRAVARALVAETTLDGAQVADIVRGSRCVCHRFTRTPPPEGSTPMSRKAPPTPIVSSDGIEIVLPKELTLDHEHAMVAKAGFWSAFASLPGGRIKAGRVWIREGQLADARSPLVRRQRDRWRKPTDADREGRNDR